MQYEISSNSGKLWTTPIPEVCVDCLRRLVDLTVSEASQDRAVRERATKAAYQIIEEFRNHPSITPAHIANRFHSLIKEISQNNDPFRARKIKEMSIARSLSRKYPPADKNLIDLLKYSLLGNSIDFFRDIDRLEESIQRTPNIVINDISQLIAKIQSGDVLKIIILADNAGEVYFDMPLGEFLASSGIEVFYAVKGAPVQNDLSMEDLVREGLKENLERMGIKVLSTGVASVGLDYQRISPEFKETYDRADLILAKGMGHLETLGKIRDKRLFYLFETKCPTIAHTLGLSIGDFVACWGDSLHAICATA